MKLCNFIQNGRWQFPNDLQIQFPNLMLLAAQGIIPAQSRRDKLIWKHSTNGELTLKDAYNLKKKTNFQKVRWAKLIWSPDFPPSKSLMVWRLMLDKLPTDDNLISIGCHFSSMCSLCGSKAETSFHLFFLVLLCYSYLELVR